MSLFSQVYMYKLGALPNPISVSVNVGNGQSAATSLYLDGQLLATGLHDSFTDRLVANSVFLSGKGLDISTAVFDINAQNNNILFHFQIEGGEEVLSTSPHNHEVPEGSVAYFLIKIIFI